MLDSLDRISQEAKPAHKQVGTENKRPVELPPRNPWYQSMWRHHRLYHYHRLVFLVCVINAVVLYQAIANWGWFAADGINLAGISNVVIANIGAAALIRQQYVINLLFKIATVSYTHLTLPTICSV